MSELDRKEELQDDGIYWSVSRLQSLESCGHKYYLRYEQHEEEGTTAALAFGSAIHRCLEEIERDDTRDDGLVAKMFDEYWWEESKNIDWSKEIQGRRAYQNKADKIFTNYAKGPKFETVSLEQEFKGEFDGQKVRGIIDRVVKIGDKLGVIDYKTSKNPPDWLILNKDYQLTSYWGGVQTLLRSVTHSLEINYFGIYHLLSGEIYWTYRDQNHWQEFKKALAQADKKVDLKMYEKNVGFACKWCTYKESCLGG